MKRLLIACLTLVMLSIPAGATHRQSTYADIVSWAGCRAALVTDDTRHIFSSHYNYPSKTLYIGTADAAELAQELAEMVLFHEIGHCLQHQTGMLDAPIPLMMIELDADRWAAELACGLGKDGKRLLHDLFVWAYETQGYEGDSAHGTLTQRIAQGDNAAMCKLTPYQAPLVSP